MPAKIDQALEFPIVKEVVTTAGEENVKRYIEFELIRVSSLVSVGGNLNNTQVQFIASELISLYPNESIADFKLCFQRGAMGQYGEIFRLDSNVIGLWMKAYVDEKYQVIESSLMQEKESHYFQLPEKKDLADPERHQQWLDKLKAATANGIKQAPDVAPQYAKPDWRWVANNYDNGLTARDAHNRQVLRRAASEFYKGRTSLKLQGPFVIEGFEIMAESEGDARAIYESVKPDVPLTQNDKKEQL
jgi:hypothetical protein